ncbi:MAG: DUF2461 domain-containing protein [Sandaracinaceae bacterium]|nr:DUF2461 domain-containing protein [Sandaracinaceae bacterium]
MAFTGFSKDTIAFLRELEANNTKVFFDANKARFDEVWARPAADFVVAVGTKLAKRTPSISFEPRVGGSLMRMNRDVRFSKDKSPYKTHLDLFFWEGDDKSWALPGFFFRLTSKELMVGAGVHALDKDALAKYRAAVADERGVALAKIVARLRKTPDVIVGQEGLKKVPRGFDPAHPRAELLRFDALHAMVVTPIPSELTSAAFVALTLSRFETVRPLREWLSGVLSS